MMCRWFVYFYTFRNKIISSAHCRDHSFFRLMYNKTMIIIRFGYLRLRLIISTSTLIILDITKTSSGNCLVSTGVAPISWLWGGLPLRLSKSQSMSSQKVLLRTTLAQTIVLHLIVIVEPIMALKQLYSLSAPRLKYFSFLILISPSKANICEHCYLEIHFFFALEAT